jgi:YHS domain-containing protein
MKTGFILPLTAALLAAAASIGMAADKAKCIVSGKAIEVTDKTPKVYVQGKARYFCCENCPKAFAKQPEKFVKSPGDCPIVGGEAAVNSGERKVVNNGLWYVC